MQYILQPSCFANKLSKAFILTCCLSTVIFFFHKWSIYILLFTSYSSATFFFVCSSSTNLQPYFLWAVYLQPFYCMQSNFNLLFSHVVQLQPSFSFFFFIFTLFIVLFIYFFWHEVFPQPSNFACSLATCFHLATTVELQWLKHLWNHENMFETGVFYAIECQS